MARFKLWGFDGSTYVRTVKMLLAEKTFSDFEQVPLNVLAGDPKTAAHLERHPFGKVPVLDDGGFRIIETAAICRYLDSILPGPSLIPSEPRDEARMNMVVGIVDSYGYGALTGGVAGYYLFPDFVGGRSEAALAAGIETGRKVIDFAMATKGGDAFIAGSELSLADLYLAPILAYVAMTPDLAKVSGAEGFEAWWESIKARPSFIATQPG